MIAEKTNTAQQIVSAISATAGKVSFINDTTLSRALLHLENKGIPTNRHEDYKYCNIDAILKKDFKNITQKLQESVSINEYKLADTITIVVLNGNYSKELSDKTDAKGLQVMPFRGLKANDMDRIASQADVESDAFIALNTAFSGEGFYLKLEKNIRLQKTVHIIYVTSTDESALINPRNFIEVGENAELTLIEQHLCTGKGKAFSNFLSEKLVNENGKLTTFTIQDEKENGYSVNTNQIKVRANARYDNTTITISGQLVRNNHNVVLDGENCEAHLHGLFITHQTQLVDNHTLMDHRKPHCESNELYKGVINDKSTGVFNGKIFVRRDAQKTNAYQSSKNILMSDEGTINTKPQLEIYADDVKCSHGTSTGKIDESAMFYLNARGIGRENAKRILLNAFASEITDKIEKEDLKNYIEKRLDFN